MTVWATRTLTSPKTKPIPRGKAGQDQFSDDVSPPAKIPFRMTLDDVPMFSEGNRSPVWFNVEEKSEDYPYSNWNMTELAVCSCKFPSKHEIPKTDSRRRQDRIALEKEDNDTAASEKHRLEEAQRHKKKIREQKGLHWVPTYFKENEADEHHRWVYQRNYWK